MAKLLYYSAWLFITKNSIAGVGASNVTRILYVQFFFFTSLACAIHHFVVKCGTSTKGQFLYIKLKVLRFPRYSAIIVDHNTAIIHRQWCNNSKLQQKTGKFSETVAHPCRPKQPVLGPTNFLEVLRLPIHLFFVHAEQHFRFFAYPGSFVSLYRSNVLSSDRPDSSLKLNSLLA